MAKAKDTRIIEYLQKALEGISGANLAILETKKLKSKEYRAIKRYTESVKNSLGELNIVLSRKKEKK